MQIQKQSTARLGAEAVRSEWLEGSAFKPYMVDMQRRVVHDSDDAGLG